MYELPFDQLYTDKVLVIITKLLEPEQEDPANKVYSEGKILLTRNTESTKTELVRPPKRSKLGERVTLANYVFDERHCYPNTC